MSESTTKTTTSLQPTIKTLRLIVRPFVAADAERVQQICSDKEIAANMRAVPYPYSDGAASYWIEQHAEFWKTGRSAIFAITLPDEDKVIGAIGLELNSEDHRAELGYWDRRSVSTTGFCH